MSTSAAGQAVAAHKPCSCSLSQARTDDEWKQLTQSAIAYAAAHVVADSATNTLIHAPVTLLPTSVHQGSYESVVALSNDWNELVDRVSRDRAFLREHLAGSALADPWLASLLDIERRLHEEGSALTQPIRLGIYRSDYMIHVEEDQATGTTLHTPQQIELNTIAASFAGLSTRVSSMHSFLLEREVGWSASEAAQALPTNEAIRRIAQSFHVAFELYKKQYGDSSLVVVMVVQPGESNAVDQRILEYTLWSTYRIPVLRRSLLELVQQHSFGPRGELMLDGKHQAAVVYFRAGYTPRDYPTSQEFDAIYLVEKSVAIKCPALSVHLAGTKKVQQVLAQPNMLEKFVSPAQANKLRACFAGLYALEKDDNETLAVIQSAIADPSAYVLKPQREGGGNNLWNGEMVEALKRMTKEERAAFILMKKISPRPSPAALLRKGELSVVECISELGIYSAAVCDGATTHHSSFCGHLLRTKAAGVDEGGVAAGFSCLSSVCFER